MKTGVDVRIHPVNNITRPELVSIGSHVAIDFCFSCTTQLVVGDYVHVAPHVSVVGGAASKLTLDHFSYLSTGTKVICGSDKMLGDGLVGPFIPKQYQDEHIVAPVTLERFAGAGANAVILPGVTMAEGSVLGAHSMLKESTEPWTIYVGSPARPVKMRPKGKILDYAARLGYPNV